MSRDGRQVRVPPGEEGRGPRRRTPAGVTVGRLGSQRAADPWRSSGSAALEQEGRRAGRLRQVPAAPTFSEEHFRCNVIWGPNQGVCQTPLMLLPGSLLQGLQPVSTTTIRHVVPEVTRLHAVLSDVAPFSTRNRGAKEENTEQSEFSVFNTPIASD